MRVKVMQKGQHTDGHVYDEDEIIEDVKPQDLAYWMQPIGDQDEVPTTPGVIPEPVSAAPMGAPEANDAGPTLSEINPQMVDDLGKPSFLG